MTGVLVVPIELDTVDGVEPIVTTCGTVVTVRVGFVTVTVLEAISAPSENEKLPMDEVAVFIGALEITVVEAFETLGFSIGFALLVETGEIVKLLLVFKVSNLKPVDCASETFATVTGIDGCEEVDCAPKLSENDDADVVAGFSFVVANPKDAVEMDFGSFDPAIVVPNANAVDFVSLNGSDTVGSFVTVMLLPNGVGLFVEILANDGKFVASVLAPSENPLELVVVVNVCFSASFATPDPVGVVKSLFDGNGGCDCDFSTVAFWAKVIDVTLVDVDIPSDGFERLPESVELAGLDT